MDANIIQFIQIYQRLPEYLGTEIFKFLVDDLQNGFYFEVLEQDHLVETNYSKKYEMATCKKEYGKGKNKEVRERLVHVNGHELARIKKKNGNRYYLSTKTVINTCDGCGFTNCRSRGCRGGFSVEKYYKSKFIGKSLNDAVFKMYYTDSF